MAGPSLPQVLTALAQHEQIMHDKITEREFADDRAALQQAFVNLQRVMVPHIAHHERTLSALASLHRELDAALDLMIETVKTYYWIVSDGYLQLDVKYSEIRCRCFSSPGQCRCWRSGLERRPYGTSHLKRRQPAVRFAPRWAKFVAAHVHAPCQKPAHLANVAAGRGLANTSARRCRRFCSNIANL